MQSIFPINYRGFTTYCTSYAGDKAGTVYASLIGRTTATTAVWAAFQSGEHIYLENAGHLHKRPKVDGTKYHTLRRRLPESDWLHLVLLHTQATVDNLPDLPFYILAVQDPPLDRFLHMWNRALPLPTKEKWKEDLWRTGVQNMLVKPVRSEGIHCWQVRTKLEVWEKQIKLIAKGDKHNV